MKTDGRTQAIRPFLSVVSSRTILDRTHGSLVRFVPVWIAVSIALSGCAVQVHNITPADVPAYTFTGQASGLKISAEPFTDKDRLARYFGDDVLSKGVLPVFVLFENQTAGDGFIIAQERSELTTSKSNTESTKDADTSHDVQASGPPFTYSTSPVGDFTVGLLFGSVGAIALEAHYTNLATIARNLQEKKIVDKIVYPGSAHHGFMYYKVENRDDAAHTRNISFDARNVRTGEMVTITTVPR